MQCIKQKEVFIYNIMTKQLRAEPATSLAGTMCQFTDRVISLLQQGLMRAYYKIVRVLRQLKYVQGRKCSAGGESVRAANPREQQCP